MVDQRAPHIYESILAPDMAENSLPFIRNLHIALRYCLPQDHLQKSTSVDFRPLVDFRQVMAYLGDKALVEQREVEALQSQIGILMRDHSIDRSEHGSVHSITAATVFPS